MTQKPTNQTILVLGSGGREHALCYALAKSKHKPKILCAPGNAGIANIAQLVDLDITDTEAVLAYCQTHHIDFVVIGSEAPAAAGVGDILEAHQISVFGCSKNAAQLEASKRFTKDLCAKLSVPTARYISADTMDAALKALDDFTAPYVIKADGLAAGKGVTIAADKSEALKALEHIFAGGFGVAGNHVVIEEFLVGEEASFFVLSDGIHIRPFGTAQDHKRAYDGDHGPNTGGMGAYSPASIMNDMIQQQAIDQIIAPIIHEMHQLGMPFKGVLYAGLILTQEGPKLIEFNVRFGDPECQVLMMRLQSDLLEILQAVAGGTLDQLSEIIFFDDVAVTVVLANQGYPNTKLPRAPKISLPFDNVQSCYIFHAGTQIDADGDYIATGGRVLNITATAPRIEQAVTACYQLVNQTAWPESFHRKDIAAKEINRSKY